MSDQELTDRVLAIITAQQKLPEGRVTPESTFEELGIDSLDGVNLLFAFEEEFDINIPEHVAQQMKDVGQVVAGLRQVLEKREAIAAAAAMAAASGAVGGGTVAPPGVVSGGGDGAACEATTTPPALPPAAEES
jgi:acyl carrier protein